MGKPLILVVEDEPKQADMIAKMINQTGRYEAVIAHSAKEGFEMLDKYKRFLGLADNQIKCIVLDIKMPEMDGLEFLKEIRRQESFMKLLPVIILTAYEDKVKWAKATLSERGIVAAYLKKPVKEEELIDTIDRILAGDMWRMVDETEEKRKQRWDKLEEGEESHSGEE